MALRAWLLLAMASMAYAPAGDEPPAGNPRFWPKGTPREPWADGPGRNPRYDRRGWTSDVKRKAKRLRDGVHERYLAQQAQTAHHAHVAQSQAALDAQVAQNAAGAAADWQDFAAQAAHAQAANNNAHDLAAWALDAPAPVRLGAHAVAAEALASTKAEKKRQSLPEAEDANAKRARNGTNEQLDSKARTAASARLKRQALHQPQTSNGKHRAASPARNAPAVSSKSGQPAQKTPQAKFAAEMKSAVNGAYKAHQQQKKESGLRGQTKTAPGNLPKDLRPKSAPSGHRTRSTSAPRGTPATAPTGSFPGLQHVRHGTKEEASASHARYQYGEKVAAESSNKRKNGAPI